MLEKGLEAINRHGDLLVHLRQKLRGAFELLANRTSRNFDAVLFGDRLNSLFTSCSLLVSDFRSLVDGLAMAAKGVVSQSLLPYSELVSLVLEAQRMFKFHPLFSEADMDHYYSLISSEVIRHFVFVHIPFTSSREFSAYMVIPFPSLVNNVQVRLKGEER